MNQELNEEKIIETYGDRFNLYKNTFMVLPNVCIKPNGTVSISFYNEVEKDYLFFTIKSDLYVLKMSEMLESGDTLRELVYNISGKTFTSYDSPYLTFIPKGKKGQCEVNIEKYAEKLTNILVTMAKKTEKVVEEVEVVKPKVKAVDSKRLDIAPQMEEFFASLVALHIEKQKEYSDGKSWDSGFVSQAAMRGRTRQEQAADGLTKHISSIFTAIDKKPLSYEKMKEKIGDAIIYLAIIHEMYLEDSNN